MSTQESCRGHLWWRQVWIPFHGDTTGAGRWHNAWKVRIGELLLWATPSLWQWIKYGSVLAENESGHSVAYIGLTARTKSLVILSQKIEGIDMGRLVRTLAFGLGCVMTTWLFCAATLSHVHGQSSPTTPEVIYKLSAQQANSDARLTDIERRLSANEASIATTLNLATRTDAALSASELIFGGLSALITVLLAILNYRKHP